MSAQYSFHLVLAEPCPLFRGRVRLGRGATGFCQYQYGETRLEREVACDGRRVTALFGIGGGWSREGKTSGEKKGVEIQTGAVSMPRRRFRIAVDSNFDCQDKTRKIKSQHALGRQGRLYVSHEEMKDSHPQHLSMSIPRLVCAVRLPAPTATPVLPATGALEHGPAAKSTGPPVCGGPV